MHALSSTASCSFTIRFDEQILDSLDDHNWAVMSDEWADFLFGSVGKMVNDCPGIGVERGRGRKFVTEVASLLLKLGIMV